jgi:hypothetical protein
MFESQHSVPPGLAQDATIAMGKSTPPAMVGALSLAGVPLEQWVVILTLIYLALQIILLVRKFFKGGSNNG